MVKCILISPLTWLWFNSMYTYCNVDSMVNVCLDSPYQIKVVVLVGHVGTGTLACPCVYIFGLKHL